MLQFNAQHWYSLSQRLASLDIVLKASPKRFFTEDKWNLLGDELKEAESGCRALFLWMSAIQAQRAIAQWREGNRERCGEEIGELHTRIRDELGLMSFFCVPKEREDFLRQAVDVEAIFAVVPSVHDEIMAGSRCYAFGENTATVFHLMRVVDFGLRRVAESLDVEYSAHNWKGIGDAIQRKMEQKYQLKTDEWKEKEPFYAGVLTDIGAIGKKHRNPTLHEFEKNYDEKEARYMLTVVGGFILHVGKELPEPNSQPNKLP